MTGRFNQDLPENLQMAFEKATNFEPRIIMKQSINSRKIHEINQIDVGQEDEIKINEAHVRNPNYKGKNYDPNFAQNRLKNNSSTNNSSNTYNNNTKSHYKSSNQHNNTNSGYGHSKPHQQEKPVNVSVTLHGPVSKDQLYKIQEVLRHPSQYRDRIKPEDCPAKGKYATVFNKFRPKKVEVNEATEKTSRRPLIYIKHWATKHFTAQKKVQKVNRINHNNDYQLSMLQKTIFHQ